MRLQGLGFEISTEGLQRGLQSERIAVRAESAFLLGYRRDANAADALRESLKDPEARVRVEAALALARLDDTRTAMPVLVKELQGQFFADAPLRAARALAVLGDPQGYPRVKEALTSELPSNRLDAVAVLPAFLAFQGKMVGTTTIDPIGALIDASHDGEPLIRRDALVKLARLDDPRVPDALQAALKDPDKNVRELARGMAR
jgi:HEAT repeat protein